MVYDRITAEEVRRQHPRVVANQIDSVMLSNQRLEKQAKSLERERTVLKSALKESKKAVVRMTGGLFIVQTLRLFIYFLFFNLTCFIKILKSSEFLRKKRDSDSKTLYLFPVFFLSTYFFIY